MSHQLDNNLVNFTIRPPAPPQEPEPLCIIKSDQIIGYEEAKPLEPPILERYEFGVLQGAEPEEKFIKGLFLYVPDKHSREMLVNAWNAITELDMWNYMRREQYSFTWSNDAEIAIILNKMSELGYDGHSGCSFGWTMRHMQYIARVGEEEYAKDYLKNM